MKNTRPSVEKTGAPAGALPSGYRTGDFPGGPAEFSSGPVEVTLLKDTAGFFRMFGDGTRLGILRVLAGTERSVRDIASEVGMSQSAISHQLSILRQARLVRARREGRVMHYRLDDEHVSAILRAGFEHAGEPGRGRR